MAAVPFRRARFLQSSTMRHLIVLIALALAFAKHGNAAPAAPPVAFVHVNVVPLATDGVLPDQTVVVDHGLIQAVGKDIAIPAGATVIDGHATAWLAPGLADMHTHSDTRDDMAVYLANGVTSVLNMGEASNAFVGRTKPAANRGEIPSPHVYTAFRVDGSPRYGSFVVRTPDEARWAVRLARTNGHDFMKVYNDLSSDAFDALVDETRVQGLPIVGHGIERVGLRRQLAAGQLMVAHAEEFLYTVFDIDTAKDANAAPGDAQIPAVVDLVRRSRAFVTADLATYAAIARQWGKPAVVDGFLRAPESRYLSPQDRLAWRREGYAGRSGSLDSRLAFLGRFVKAMSDAGVPLITGTDAPAIPGMAPGFSLHDDMDRLVLAGLSRQQVLAAASRTPGRMVARAFPDQAPFGSVTPGARADLVLSAANPLDDLATLRAPLGVMADGRWYDRERLRGLLQGVARGYADAAYPA
jgi:amidohydrolase family protein